MSGHRFATPRPETAQRDHGDTSWGAEPLPNPTGIAPYRLDFGSIVPAKATSDRFIVDIVGDSGCIKSPERQMSVADCIAAQDPSDAMYHVGDVVYYNGQRSDYYDQFYEPYNDLDIPIFAIPGNHDGDPVSGDTSLDGFMANFCQATAGVHLPEAEDAVRTGMVQPNCYWTLATSVATFVGMYSNVPEGGYISPEQQNWLNSEFAAADPDKWLIATCHHPPLSADAYHSGSSVTHNAIATATMASNRAPELVLSGHVHNYQRFSLSDQTFCVVGAGGYYNLHSVVQNVGWIDPTTGGKLEAFDDQDWGHLRLTIHPTRIHGVYRAATGGIGTVKDRWTLSR